MALLTQLSGRRGFPCRRSGSVTAKAALLVCLIGGVSLALHFEAQAAEPPSEYQVKAAFLLNFTKFVQWPSEVFADSTSPLSICVEGNDPFGKRLDEMLEGESIDSRKLQVQRLQKPPEPRSCQVLFISATEKNLIPKILDSIGPGVLTVSEMEGFVRQGGMITFVIENHHVRFDINEAAAVKAGLKISSKLLGVARSVEK